MTARNDDGPRKPYGMLEIIERDEDIVIIDKPLNGTVHHVTKRGLIIGVVVIHNTGAERAWMPVTFGFADALEKSGCRVGEAIELIDLLKITPLFGQSYKSTKLH